MEYNDFPILDDSQYKLMQDKFNEQFAFDREETCFSVFLDLKNCCNSIPLLRSQLNAETSKQLANWLKFEQKEYFKQFILNLLEDISFCLYILLNSLENANLRLFKHI